MFEIEKDMMNVETLIHKDGDRLIFTIITLMMEH